VSSPFMNVLVVEGAGYVGGALTDLLLEAECNVRVYDALLYEESYRKPVPFVFGDVRDRPRLRQHLDWADAVVWLAALVGDGACALNPQTTACINLGAVKWMSQNFDGRIVFLSTCSVYGAQDDLLDESSPTNPLSQYAATKLEAERDLADKNAVIFRLGTLFGVGDLYSRIRLDLVVNTLTVRASRFGKIRVDGGEQFRPLLHVRDAARAIADVLSSEQRGIFNLHEENVRIIDLAHSVREHFPGLVISVQRKDFADTRNYRVSSEKARKILGFSPKLSSSEGIEDIKLLLDSGRLKDVDNPRYTNHGFLSLFGTHVQPEYPEPALEDQPSRRDAA